MLIQPFIPGTQYTLGIRLLKVYHPFFYVDEIDCLLFC